LKDHVQRRQAGGGVTKRLSLEQGGRQNRTVQAGRPRRGRNGWGYQADAS